MGEARSSCYERGRTPCFARCGERSRLWGAGHRPCAWSRSRNGSRERIPTENLNVVINESYRQGMGTSLHAGLAALPPDVDAALIVLADRPFRSSEDPRPPYRSDSPSGATVWCANNFATFSSVSISDTALSVRMRTIRGKRNAYPLSCRLDFWMLLNATSSTIFGSTVLLYP